MYNIRYFEIVFTDKMRTRFVDQDNLLWLYINNSNDNIIFVCVYIYKIPIHYTYYLSAIK